MSGAGGRTVASKLAEYLQARTALPDPWTIFDKNLIEKVLEDHHLSRRIARFMPEAHKSLLEDTLEDFLRLHPPIAALVQKTCETILSLAEKGQVIVVGRGGNIVTSKLPTAFHVRLVGSVEKRVARLKEVYDFDDGNAREFLKVQDAAKKRYLRDHFNRDIDDPLLYHVVINTDGIDYEQAAHLIGDAVIRRFDLAPEAGPKKK